LASKLKTGEVTPTYKVYNRSDHNISRAQISDDALKVLYRLKSCGFQAYLVGGCVRDLLLGRVPKDFDVVTDARPEQIKSVFRNCRLIGRRFRLAHIYFGRDFIEVATFRGADNKGDRVITNGRLLRDNVYGSLEEDVWRRDFSINALYYSIHDFSVSDFVNGMNDLVAGRLKLIGDSEERFREDPVRMLRAVRFATKLGFTIDPDCEPLIPRFSELLKDIPAARLYDETLKLFLSGYAVQTFELLRRYHLFEALFPLTEESLAIEKEGFPSIFLAKALENTDKRINQNKPVTAYFLMAVFLWEPVRSRAERKIQSGCNHYIGFNEAASEVIQNQIRHTAFPRRISQTMREVWSMQPQFENRNGERPFRLLKHIRFRAAYDFLLLRTITGEVDQELADWWTQFQEVEESQQKKMTGTSKRKRRKRRRPAQNKQDHSVT